MNARTAAILLCLLPSVAAAQWEAVRSTDAMTDSQRVIAYAPTSSGHATGLFRARDGSVYLMLTAPRKPGVMPFASGGAMLRVDKRPAVAIPASLVQSRAFSAAIQIWDASSEPQPPIIDQLRTGKLMLIRLPLVDGTHRDITVGVGGAAAVDEALGLTKPQPLTADEAKRLECEAATDRQACLAGR